MITPTTVNFNYKKFGAIPPGVILYHDYNFASNPTIPLQGLGFIQLYDANTSSVKIKLIAPPADDLPVGLNTFNLDVKLYDIDLEEFVIVGSITLNITVEDTVLLNISPNNVAFNFEIGSANPVNNLISVNSENDWTVTKTQSWLSLSATSGSNSGSFEIGVVTTGLSNGSYTDTVTVNDGVTTKNVAVTLTVTDPNTGTDFLYVNPTLLKYGFTIGGTIPPAKNIELNTSDAFTASVNQPWLELPTTSGAAGAQIIQLAVKSGTDLDALTEGVYFATVTITVGTIVRTVDVELEIYNFIASTPSNTELLFTEENNILSLKSGRLDTFMQLNFTSAYNSNLYKFTAEIPFFKGGAQRNLGVIPNKIIGNQNLIGLADISVFQPYFPCIINTEIHEKELFTEAIVATSSVNNLKFLKGYKPINNFLSEIAKTIFVTPDATICFSVLSGNVATASIFITGTITKEINVDQFISTDKDFYTVVLPIKYIADFSEGHEINITFLNETLTAVIVEDHIESTMVYWENSNGCFDSLELKGEVTITPEMKRKTSNFRLSENTTINKTLEVRKPKKYTINTGIVHTNQELQMIEKMLYSKNIFIQTQGFIVPVIPTTTRIPTYKTLQVLKTFDINFTNAEE